MEIRLAQMDECQRVIEFYNDVINKILSLEEGTKIQILAVKINNR